MSSSKKTINSFAGLVYSTNPDEMKPIEEVIIETPSPSQQKLRVIIDKKQRKGKLVTLVENFKGKDEDLQNLGKLLKTKCGTGGNVKDGYILIQGDFKEKIIIWLKELGYSQTK